MIVMVITTLIATIIMIIIIDNDNDHDNAIYSPIMVRMISMIIMMMIKLKCIWHLMTWSGQGNSA
jgi:hypothetical protein